VRGYGQITFSTLVPPVFGMWTKMHARLSEIMTYSVFFRGPFPNVAVTCREKRCIQLDGPGVCASITAPGENTGLKFRHHLFGALTISK
jgi:hypothetical protein